MASVRLPLDTSTSTHQYFHEVRLGASIEGIEPVAQDALRGLEVGDRPLQHLLVLHEPVLDDRQAPARAVVTLGCRGYALLHGVQAGLERADLTLLRRHGCGIGECGGGADAHRQGPHGDEDGEGTAHGCGMSGPHSPRPFH